MLGIGNRDNWKNFERPQQTTLSNQQSTKKIALAGATSGGHGEQTCEGRSHFLPCATS